MNISQKLQSELTRLIGFSSQTPKSILLNSGSQNQMEIDLTAVDSMSCSVTEIRMIVPKLVNANFDILKKWSDELCQRITYLLEGIGPLELDPDSSKVLIRSTKPETDKGKIRYYEIMLQSQSGGNFVLQRYEYFDQTNQRNRVDLKVTHEILRKLSRDLFESIPE